MIYRAVGALLRYALGRGLIESRDLMWAQNRLLHALGLDHMEQAGPDMPLQDILRIMDDYAQNAGLIPADSPAYRDIFDAGIMGLLTPRPSEVLRTFLCKYSQDPRSATNYFYDLSLACDYIRSYRVAKDVKWVCSSRYGDIDVTINLSKPEKDPKAIAAARLSAQSDYPKCQLCRQNEGFSGGAAKPPRQNLRLIPLRLDGQDWYLQYSPYVYYNEHCIALSGSHVPMRTDSAAFRRMLDFIDFLPHYFIGANADLPIVGGSILSHDHMQGGRYTFAMQRAGADREVVFDGYADVRACILRWPVSVIRIRSADRQRLAELADRILAAWRGYSDPSAFIYAQTGSEPHNTVTAIARMRGGEYEFDLALRNNITTPEHPLGLFHPHEQFHNIKKENIGLIEVMGLAVLPARLKDEMALLAQTVLSGGDIASEPSISKHAAWFGAFKDKYAFTKDNIDDILRRQIGDTFVQVLECAGVYKRTAEGQAAFDRFIGYVNSL